MKEQRRMGRLWQSGTMEKQFRALRALDGEGKNMVSCTRSSKEDTGMLRKAYYYFYFRFTGFIGKARFRM